MADKPLFNLDAEGRWRLAYDRQQWIIQRRTKKARVSHTEGGSIADSGWRGVAFVGGTKTTLRRVLREAGVGFPSSVARRRRWRAYLARRASS